MNLFDMPIDLQLLIPDPFLLVLVRLNEKIYVLKMIRKRAEPKNFDKEIIFIGIKSNQWRMLIN